MIPFARLLRYGNEIDLPDALVYLPMVDDSGTAVSRQVGIGYYPGNVTATPLSGYISHHRLYLRVLADSEIDMIYKYELGGAI